MTSLEPTPEQFTALADRRDQPVVMIKLLQFNADGGRESYVRYTQEVTPHLQRVGGTVHYAGASPSDVVKSPGGTPLSFSSTRLPAAFLDMVTSDEYLKVHEHRAAGLDRDDLIATSIWTIAD